MNENILSLGEINRLKSSIEPLKKRLNEYMKNNNNNSLVSFLRQIHLVFSQINLIIHNLTFAIEQFNVDIEIPENYERLVLIFERSFSLEEISAKLSAINLIYEEFCLILNINSQEFPIRVIKVETGSLEIKIDGIKDVIDLIKYVIDKAFDLINKNSQEGKIKSITETEMVAFEKYLDLTKKAQEQGYNVSTENIKQLHSKIGQSLGNLLEPSFKMNEKEYIVADENTQTQTAYLEGSKNLLLEEGKEEEKDNDSKN